MPAAMADASASPPAGRTLQRATLARVVEHHPGTRSLFLALPAEQRLAFVPGQFVSCRLPVAGGAPLVRAYSIASSPDDDELEICVDLIAGGPGSAYLFGLAPGAVIEFTGPFGSFALAEPPAASMVFVAEGTAIAPIRPMLRRALERGGGQRIDVLQGARYEHELLFRDEFEGWAHAHPRLHWEPVLATTEAEHGPLAALEELVVERFVRGDQDRRRRFWICSVGALAGRLRDALRAAGYERRAVRAEQW
jgi:ferredoxin-NADP reductase